MPQECSGKHSQYFYNASAFGIAADIQRPVRQTIPAQAATALHGGSGRGTLRVEDFNESPFIRFDAAYTEVGGSFDECHNLHATYASSVIEGLNIADVVLADRVVSRMVSYSPEVGNEDGEHSYDITGSHFENLRIAGHKLDIKLSTHVFSEHDTYAKFANAYQNGNADHLLPWGNQDKKRLDMLESMEKKYHALTGIGARAKKWAARTKATVNGGTYWCSAAGHLNLKQTIGDSELEGFGGIIVIPKFGIVRLAELIVHRDYRKLTMVRVQMCSGSTGGVDGGHTTSGSGSTFP
jgi:hypothetical protein